MRASGILLPISSLPSPYGIGTLGKEAFEFVDFEKPANLIGKSCRSVRRLTVIRLTNIFGLRRKSIFHRFGPIGERRAF